GRPFLYVDDQIDLHALYHFMINEWKLETPNIVVPIYSSTASHKSFKNGKMVEALKKGIRNVVNASKIWFITNGFDVGMPQLIGSAFRDEISLRRANEALKKKLDREQKTSTLIGIVCEDEIKNFVDLRSSKGNLKKELKIPRSKYGQLSLNSDHTHFIILRKSQIDFSSANISETKLTTTDTNDKSLEKITAAAQRVTNKFRNRFEAFLHQEAPQKQATTLTELQLTTTDTLPAASNKADSSNEYGFPMICILLQGTTETIELVYRKIQREVPIVVLKGTGSAADLIAFAYEEFIAKNKKISENDFFKVELTQYLLDEYSELKDNNFKRNEIRNYVMSIVKEVDKEGRKFLSFVDINSTTSSLNNFHKLILSALLQGTNTYFYSLCLLLLFFFNLGQKLVSVKKTDVTLKSDRLLKKRTDQLGANLRLTLDWNLPDLALSDIFQLDDGMTFSVTAELFDMAILEENLEAFVDLFLDRQFVLHRYLNSKKFIYLFKKAKDKDFFTITSLEGLLGLSGDDEELPEEFVESHLNEIVKRLTGIKDIFSKVEMNCNAMGIYYGDKSDNGVQKRKAIAEERALQHLVIYAVLMNRHQLAKILWKHSSEPIPLALICYMMFKNLGPYCHETYQKSLIKKRAQEFSDWAVGILDQLFHEDNVRIFVMLSEKNRNWNNMTTIQLAYHAGNKEFVAHAVCQKWVTRKFYGNITPQEVSWGLFSFPKYLKIILSAILIFPMYFWISFSPIGKASPVSEKASDVSDDVKQDAEKESKLSG
ncbi:unnamed protein product, partial [Rotaria sp. Silwood2]